MITSWQLYWLLMLDNIRLAATVANVLGLIATVVCPAVGIGLRVTGGNEGIAVGRKLHRIGMPTCMFVFVMSGLVLLFTPTTKQAAVIWAVPMIATEQNIATVQGEAGEVYGLAKQWLQEHVDEKGGKE